MAQTLIERSLAALHSARANLRDAEPDSPEWEEANAVAGDAEWQHSSRFDGAKRRLSHISHEIAATTRRLADAQRRQGDATAGSPAARRANLRVQQEARTLVGLASEEQRVGATVDVPDESMAGFERRSARRPEGLPRRVHRSNKPKV
jgi:hypothetical protein